MDYYTDDNYSHMAVEFQVFLIFFWYDNVQKYFM